MLADYARYIENIRNGLIQCGVIFPQIEEIDTADYGSLFHIGEKVSDILYFYKIMVCSGNMDELFIPMNKSYRGAIRSDAFIEFKEDILPLLKEQLGDEEPGGSFSLDTLCDLGAFDGSEEPEEWVNDEESAEDTLIGLEDLFGDDDESVSVGDQFVSSGASLWGTGSTEWVSNGTSLFGSKSSSIDQKPLEYVSHGASLFDSQPNIANQKTEYVSNGTELFSLSVGDSVSADFSQDVWEDDPDSVYDDSQDVLVSPEEPAGIWEDGSDGIWEDDEVFEEGSVFSEENPEDSWAEDDIYEDDSAFVEDNQDSWVSDDEDYEDTPASSPQKEGVFEENPEDVWVSDEDEEDLWVSEPSQSSTVSVDWQEEPAPDVKAQSQQSVVFSNTPAIQKKPVNADRDIVDSVQDAASAALTSAKRFLANITSPKK